MKEKHCPRKFLEIFLIFGGLVLLLIPAIFQRISSRPRPELENLTQPEKITAISIGLPLRIVIPQVSIDLPVKEAKVEGNNWELFEDAAAYLSTSAKIGEDGNTVIYAHAKPHLFGPLKKIKKGERVYILVDNGWAVYEVVGTKAVPPTGIEIVSPTEEKTLTLYTCTNFLDKDRFVVSAKLITSNLKTSP